MYVPRLRKRIPAQVRDRAIKAGFRDPDWYAGPLVDDELEAAPEDFLYEANSEQPPAGSVREQEGNDLMAELDEEIAEGVSKMTSKPSFFRRFWPGANPQRQLDAR